MKFKVVSWNMGHWTHRNATQEAWNYLETEIAADISLVQESAPPAERKNEYCVWHEIGGTGKWGSGVLTKLMPVKEFQLERNDYTGALTVAEVTLPDKTTLFAASAYGNMYKNGYSITTLHRMLSDRTHLFEGGISHGRRPLVNFGGDLNASPQFDDDRGHKTHRIFFQRIEAFDLMDCQGEFGKDRPRTLRHSKSDFPWVNDYIFASKSLAQKVVAREVIEQPKTLNLSDHNPVVVTFDL